MKPPTVLERWADGAVKIVSPKRAVWRGHWRRMERDGGYRETVFALLRARGYRDAQSSDTQTPWLSQGGSADAEILADLPALRNRSRELSQVDPIASGLVKTFVSNVIGTGLRPDARVLTQDDKLDTETNKAMESVWWERADLLHPADGLLQMEAQRLKLRRVLEDGEHLVKVAKDKAGTPLYFELIEGDRLATPLTRTAGTSVRIVDGVEKDAVGRPVAYHIQRGHPGEQRFLRQDDFQFDRVPAELVRHLKITDRPGQTRGVPFLHAILQDLRDLDLLLKASLKRVQVAACLAAFIKTTGTVDELMTATAEKYEWKAAKTLEPGTVTHLYPEEEIQTLVPNFPTPELGPFIVMFCRRIGAALGVSWQIVLKDFSESTYSSARTDLLESRQVYRFFRTWFSERCLQWEWRFVMEDARLRGDARLQGVSDEAIASVTWTGDAWEWVDPRNEVQALQIELQTGISTLDEIWLRLGKDPDEMKAKLEAQRELLDLLAPLQPKAAVPIAPQKSGNGDGQDNMPDEGDSEDMPARHLLPRRNGVYAGGRRYGR